MKQVPSGQDAIWDYYQNQDPASFDGSMARVSFLVGQTKPNAKCLNIGVGQGNLERIACKKGVDIYALDPSSESIARLSELLGEKAKIGYCQDIPFSDGFFDMVIMTEVLEHLDVEVLNKTLEEVQRVLKPKGVFIGTVPSNEDLKANIVVSPSDGHVFHRWGHLQSFNFQRLTQLLESNFSKVSVKEKLFVNWHTLNWKGKIISGFRLLSKSLGSSGTGRNLFFEAIK